MKVNEIISEKQLNEIAPLAALIPWALKGLGGAAARTAATSAGKAVATKIATVAPKAGIANKIRQWTSKAPPDSSTPDALKNKVGYGAGQVDPPLAKAARKQSVVEPKDKVAKPQGKLSPAASAAIARATT